MRDATSDAKHETEHEATIPDTLISLIVAFAIAMAFRGFVLEGFVIPTGSMAPTLVGEHMLIESPLTGYAFRADTGARFVDPSAPDDSYMIVDPMLGRDRAIEEPTWAEVRRRTRAGDRVLVLKWFYSLVNPNRFDVIVFKNPTDSRENYIKRLVGLPLEEVWLADGDVFVRDAGDLGAPFTIRRKPLHVQRAVWRPVYDSRYAHAAPSASPWADVEYSAENPGEFHLDGPRTMVWESRRRPLDDWNAYNLLASGPVPPMPVSDLRIVAQFTPDQADLSTALRLRARAHVYELVVQGDRLTLRAGPHNQPSSETWPVSSSIAIKPLHAGRAVNIEFWHVDQALYAFINGRRVAKILYDWTARERLRNATGQDVDTVLENSNRSQPWVAIVTPNEPSLEWELAGPATVHRVRVDRDLYYRPAFENDYNGPPAVGTHPERTAVLGRDQFFMLGDNSAHSLDGRKWGNPDALISNQIDDAPFIVHRKLILGRAWFVYFPAPYSLKEGGARFIPDFGRMRFIR